MNAEKIEVGDVWENDGLILYVGKLSTDENEKIIGYCYDMDKKGYVAGCWYWMDVFVNNAKYLGKSKASIRDLFCVKENAENVVQTDLRNIDDMQKKIEFAKEAVDLFFKTEDESKLLEIAEWE